LGDRSTSLRIVAELHYLGRIDVDIIAAGKVELNGNIGWKVELRIQSAGSVAGLDRCRGGELVDVRRTGGRAVETLLDTVAFVFDQGEGEVNFGDHASHIEAAGV
jgi:hypothetical protein